MKTDSRLAIIPFEEIVRLINPLQDKLVQIEDKLDKNKFKPQKKYYRNKDLKENFGFCPNTIIKYREASIIPYTIIGEIYLYPVVQLEEILRTNSNWDLFQNKAS
jgi:hypothetical protein